MQLSGPLPISTSNAKPLQDLQLRLNQRITAEVVEVSGVRVVLSVEGMPIVARLEDPEKGAQLAGRRVAQFIVTSLNEGEVELRIATPPQTTAPVPMAAGSDVAVSILQRLGVGVDETSVLLARALIAQHLPVTPEMLDEMQALMAGLGSWGEAEASLAAAIKAAGLPLTVDIFRMVSAQSTPLGKAMVDFSAFLRAAVERKDLPKDVADALRGSLALLQQAMLDWDSPEGLTANKMRFSAELFGRSLENLLLSGASADGAENTLLTFTNLLEAAVRNKMPGLEQQTRTFLESLQQNHLSNVRLNPVPGQGEWRNLHFVIQNQGEALPEFSTAQVRVARREGPAGGGVDSTSTRLLIQVDVDEGETIEVDLTVVDRQARTKVTSTNEELQHRSQEEMPALVKGLNQLGYQMVGVNFQIGHPAERGLVSLSPASTLLKRRINLKV